MAEASFIQNLPQKYSVYYPRVNSIDVEKSMYTMDYIYAPSLRDIALFLDKSYETWVEIFNSINNFVRLCETSISRESSSYWGSNFLKNVERLRSANLFLPEIKDKYERGYNEKYVTPIVKSKKTNKDKRIAYSKLPKPECINCKRNVGTIFTIHNDKEEDIRKFIAKCGDITDPCPLNIQINSSFRDSLNSIIITGSKSIEKIKLDIIKEIDMTQIAQGNDCIACEG